jgi:hypothetical protein
MVCVTVTTVAEAYFTGQFESLFLKSKDSQLELNAVRGLRSVERYIGKISASIIVNHGTAISDDGDDNVVFSQIALWFHIFIFEGQVLLTFWKYKFTSDGRLSTESWIAALT